MHGRRCESRPGSVDCPTASLGIVLRSEAACSNCALMSAPDTECTSTGRAPGSTYCSPAVISRAKRRISFVQKLSREAALLISKSKIKLIRWDVAEHLRTPYEMALYLEATFEEFGHEGRAIIRALGDIARAQGMTSVARRSGLGRESLYKALSGEGNPSFDTVLRVLDARGLRLTAVARQPA